MSRTLPMSPRMQHLRSSWRERLNVWRPGVSPGADTVVELLRWKPRRNEIDDEDDAGEEPGKLIGKRRFAGGQRVQLG